MKQLIAIIACLCLGSSAILAQAPLKFSYEGIARDASGTPLANQALGLRLSILDGSATGAVAYQETQATTTNAFGLYSVQIGAGTVIAGTNLKDVVWAVGDKYLKVEIDPAGGTSYAPAGTSQLLSVPYALNALNAQYPANPLWQAGTGTAIFNSSLGNVGIGTTTPNNQLEIGTAPSFTGNNLAMGNGVKGMSFFQSNTASNWYSSTNFAIMPYAGGNGYVGIGTASPSEELTVFTPTSVNGISQTDGTIKIATFVGGAGKGGYVGTVSNHPLYFFTNNGSAQVSLLQNGNFGVGTASPTSKVQFGSVGSSGYNGDDLAIGNGAQAMAFALTPGATTLYSTTDIAMYPKGGTGGAVRVTGILTVDGNAPYQSPTNYFGYLKQTANNSPVVDKCYTCTANVSIKASDNVMAAEFDCISDARVKDIAGVSNSSTDLDILRALQVTDYTMKDKARYGDKPFKKVIAQQVESVYPQVVSKNTEYIPNVYEPATTVAKCDGGYELAFAGAHHLSPDAKSIRLVDRSGMHEYGIVSIPSPKQVVVAAALLGDTVFAYGEQVNDFRTVDYEGLTTLNISATQELSKRLEQQQGEIEAQRAEIRELKAQTEQLRLANEQLRSSVNELRSAMMVNATKPEILESLVRN